VAELVDILGAGSNVVSSSMMQLIYPPAADPRPVRALTEACELGHSTLFTSGIDPGFSGDAMAMAALQICDQVETLRIQELSDYGAHPDATWAVPYGFGQPEGAPAPILEPGVPTVFWGGMVRMMADVVHAELDSLEEFCERWYATESFDVPIGRIEEGSLAAVRFGVAGTIGARQRVIVEHVTRMRGDMAPHWPAPPAGTSSVHRVEIEGRPSVTLDLRWGTRRDDGHGHGLLATAMRLVNAIPAVAAPPGLVTPLALHLGIGRSLLAPVPSSDGRPTP
jgi:2,4-diaminopentanoate dehydrogenase